ncbi:hypothetical protein DPH57_17090 [Massilia sp. YMA4]|nr:hypothetical protein DPH57_17090 [Massilia sp. YMA4]
MHANGAGPARIDGVDVAQLLHGLGEASATSSALDLFGLCLGAQRVLVQVQAGSASALAQDEAAMLAAYRAMNGTMREIVLEFARTLAKPAVSQRPSLSLVKGESNG